VQRLPLFGHVIVQVSERDQAVVPLHVVGNQPRCLSFVEFVWPILLQTRKRSRKVPLAQDIAFVVKLSAV